MKCLWSSDLATVTNYFQQEKLGSQISLSVSHSCYTPDCKKTLIFQTFPQNFCSKWKRKNANGSWFTWRLGGIACAVGVVFPLLNMATLVVNLWKAGALFACSWFAYWLACFAFMNILVSCLWISLICPYSTRTWAVIHNDVVTTW